VRIGQIGRALGGERRRSGEQLDRRAGQGVFVGGGGRSLALQDFRGGVGQRDFGASGVAGPVPHVFDDGVGRPEIGQHRPAPGEVRVDQNVGGLDVTVYDAATVRVVERGGDLGERGQAILERAQAGRLATVDVLHRQPERPVPVHRDDVRVFKGARERELPVQPALLGRGAVRLVEDFQCHGHVGFAGVMGPIHARVPATSDLVLDQVAAVVDAGSSHGPRLWRWSRLRRG